MWQVGSFGGIVDEVQALKRDKNVLMLELVRLRQQHQVTANISEARLNADMVWRVITRLEGAWLMMRFSQAHPILILVLAGP